MRYIIYLILPCIFLFEGCKDYLDLVPEKDIETVETVFEKRENADDWLKSCYSYLAEELASCSGNPAIFGSDEVVSGEYVRGWETTIVGFKIADGLQMSQEPYANVWTKNKFYAALRYCNIFIEKIDGVYNMEELEKRQWKAEVKALKALLYFELVRRYGPIVLVPENIDVKSSIDVMQQPRSHVDTCFKTIVNLLDEACKDLQPFGSKAPSRYAYFNLEAAKALKAKALLYAASPLFNGNEFYVNFKDKNGNSLFSERYDAEKWKLAALAAEEAIEICEANGRKLYDEVSSEKTKLLNDMQNIEHSVLAPSLINNEVLLLIRPRNYGYDEIHPFILPRFPSNDWSNYNASAMGIVGPSMKMVEMYYTDHGLPINQDRTWNYAGRYRMGKETDTKYNDVVPLNTAVLNLHLHREPRFYACVAADRCYWKRGSNILVNAYKGEQLGVKEDIISSSYPQNLCGYWIKKFLDSSIGTVNYPNEISSKDIPYPFLRVAELYLMKAEAWNEYEGPKVDKDHVYAPLNVVRARAGILDVETAWRSYAKNPEKVDTREGMREIIRQEINIEFAFEGHRFWNIRRWKTAHEEMNEKLYGWNDLGETAQKFYNNFNGPVVVWNKLKFVSPRDYFFPLRSEEVVVSNYVQNLGW